MKIWKLISGILSIVMFNIIRIQSYATGIVNALENNIDDTSGRAGFIVAFTLLVAGVLSACIWRIESKGGYFALIVLYSIAAITGYINWGTFQDLVVWSSWALLCAIVFVISLHRLSLVEQNHDIQQETIHEKDNNIKTIKRCPYCDSVILEGNLFCQHCGEKLPSEKVCTNCGKQVKEGARFCPHCGTSLSV